MTTLLALAMVQPAHAWRHTGSVWFPTDMPVSWYMDDDLEDSLPDEYRLEVMQEGYREWEDGAECAHITQEFMGEGDYGQTEVEGLNAIYWDDPGDEFEPGILGVTTSSGLAQTKLINGEVYYRFFDADITFNNDIDWGTTEEIASGNCNNQTAVEGVATHEIGHWWGMGHSCEEGEPCDDQAKRDATMFWSVGQCDLSQNDINEDDEEGITALYGPFGTFQTREGFRRSGGTPLDFCLDLSSEQEILSIDINWGDGTDHGTDLSNTCHTYTTSGQFTVTVMMELADEVCGSYETSTSELAYVLSCEPPKPAEGAERFFQMEPVEGLTWQTINHADVSVYGCIDTIEWQVYEGKDEGDISEENVVDLNGDYEGVGMGAWSPKIAFPKPGNYVVLMNIGGPGGLKADYLAVTVEEVRSEGGCATVPAAASALGVLVAAAASARRRRSR
ncbi:MAG: matrixin family metalloprotease [Myxococcota bacterium]